jgi:osmoprotectant transport system permease protein
VWTVGTATLATPIGQACLGNYIFAGLQTRNWTMLLVGVIAAAALALVLDAILAAAERAVSRRPRGGLVAPGLGLAALVVVVLGLLPRLGGGPGPAIPRPSEPARAARSQREGVADAGRITQVRIGAKVFTEQYILAEVLRQRLADRGIAAELVESLGSNVVFDALRRGDLDAYVDYSGTLWTTQLGRDRGAPRWQILAEVEGHLASEGVRSLGPLGFQNAYALAVRRDTATRFGLRSVGDLAPHAAGMALGADYEFLSRREWTAVRTTYGLRFGRTASFDPALLYEAVARGEVDVISAFSSDGRIAAFDLVVLDDPAAALPSYDAMVLLGPRVAGDTEVRCALAPLRDALSVELMQRANLRVDRDHETPREAAAWLLGRAAIAETCAAPAAGASPRR